MDAFVDKQLFAAKNDLEQKWLDAFDKGRAAQDKLRELTKNGTVEPVKGTADANAADHCRLAMRHYADRQGRAERELRESWEALRTDLLKKLNDGILVAKGFRAPHIGGSPEITIRQDEWRILALDNVKSEATTKRDGQVAYTGVVIRET